MPGQPPSVTLREVGGDPEELRALQQIMDEGTVYIGLLLIDRARQGQGSGRPPAWPWSGRSCFAGHGPGGSA